MKDKDKNYRITTTIAVVVAIILLIVTIIVVCTDGDKLYSNNTNHNGHKENTENIVSNETKDLVIESNDQDNNVTENNVEGSDKNNDETVKKIATKNNVLIYAEGKAGYKNGIKTYFANPKEDEAKTISQLGKFKIYEDFKVKETKKLAYKQSDNGYKFDLDDSDELAIFVESDYNIVPRKITTYKTAPKKLIEANEKLKSYKEVEVVSCDLDNDKKEEYIVVANNGDNNASKVYVFNNSFKQVAKLMEIVVDENNGPKEYDHFEMDDIFILDIDADKNMEILVRKHVKEGIPSLELYRYKSGKVEGNVDLKLDLH